MILEQGHAGEQRQVLERAGDAVAGDAVSGHGQQVVALEQHPALRRLIDPADYVEHGGLACAVRPDEPTDLALVDREAEAIERVNSAEPNRHALNVKQSQCVTVPRDDVSIGTR